MSEEFKNAFNKLNINEKRNAISSELFLIGELIKKVGNKYGINSMLNIKNYNTAKDENLSDEQMLLFIYEDIYNIQKELITLLLAIDINSNK